MKNKIFITLMLMLLPSVAFAAEQDVEVLNGIKDFFAEFSAVIISVAGIVISWFLTPEWMTGSVIGIDEVLKQIWILVSNFVYLIFAGILIWISFANIVGIGGDTYQLKKAIPKFIVSVLIVPFTWFIVQFVISLSSILTSMAIQFPSDIMMSMESNKGVLDTVKSQEIPTNCTLDLNKVGSGYSGGAGAGEKVGALNCESSATLKEVFTGDSKNNIYGVLSTYTHTIFNVKDFDKISKLDISEGITSGFSMLFGTTFNLIILVALAILLFALLLALAVRAMRLWLYAALSPIFALFIFFGKTSDGLKNFDIKNLISLALVPVYVSFALTLGMIMLLFIMSDSAKLATGDKVYTSCTEHSANNGFGLAGDTSGDGESNVKLCYNDKKIFTVEGMPFPVGDPEDNTKSANPIAWLLVRVLGLVILWGTVMAALRTSEITKAVVEPFYNIGKNLSKIGTEGYKHVPIPFSNGLSLHGLDTVSKMPMEMLNTKSSLAASPYRQKISENFGSEAKTKAIQDVKESVTKNSLSMRNFMTNADKLKGVAQVTGTGSKDLAKAFEEIIDWFNKSKVSAETKRSFLKEFGIEGTDKLESKHLNNVISMGDTNLLRRIDNGEFKKARNNISTFGASEGEFSKYDGNVGNEAEVNIENKTTLKIFAHNFGTEEAESSTVYLAKDYSKENHSSADSLIKSMTQDDISTIFGGINKSNLEENQRMEIVKKVFLAISGKKEDSFEMEFTDNIKSKLGEVGLTMDYGDSNKK